MPSQDFLPSKSQNGISDHRWLCHDCLINFGDEAIFEAMWLFDTMHAYLYFTCLFQGIMSNTLLCNDSICICANQCILLACKTCLIEWLNLFNSRIHFFILSVSLLFLIVNCVYSIFTRFDGTDAYLILITFVQLSHIYCYSVNGVARDKVVCLILQMHEKT